MTNPLIRAVSQSMNLRRYRVPFAELLQPKSAELVKYRMRLRSNADEMIITPEQLRDMMTPDRRWMPIPTPGKLVLSKCGNNVKIRIQTY